MATISRLVTFVDIAGEMSHSARHEAVLEDGRRVVLLDDRGWSATGLTTREEIERTARVVVGPDEPFAGRTRADMEADHWDHLVRILRQQGIDIEAAQLRGLAHDVELSDRVIAGFG